MVPAAQFPGWQWLSLRPPARSRCGAPGPSTRPLAGARPRHGDHGHAGQPRRQDVARLVGGGPGGRPRGHDRHADAVQVRARAASGRSIYLDVAAGVTVAVLAGRYLESRAKDRSGAALTALGQLAARTVVVARRRRAPGPDRRPDRGRRVHRPARRTGRDRRRRHRRAVGRRRVGADRRGSCRPRSARATRSPAASVNMSGRRVALAATRVGADTMLAQITRLVSQALATKAAAQRLADRIAPAVFVPCAITLVRGDARLLAGRLVAGRGGRERCGGRPGRGLPVRPGPGHPHRPAGRGRPRRRAGRAGHQRAGARVGRAGARGDPGQDRHPDHRADDAARDHHRAGRR